MAIIKEAQAREFMSDQEKKLQRQLVALLNDDGRGHKHALYAKRLKKFDIKIVPISIDPSYTASMDFNNNVIRVSEGFLNCPPPKKGEKFPALFRQLSVLMRHELAHYLMQHQIRMARKLENKFGKEGKERMLLSHTLHDLDNIIADFEISNERYSNEDRETVRNMILNGRLIGGLVTEDHRKDWKELKIENMYDALTNEIQDMKQEIANSLAATGRPTVSLDKDFIKNNIASGYFYLDTVGRSNFIDVGAAKNYKNIVDAFINNKALYHFIPFDNPKAPAIFKMSGLPKEWQQLIKNIYEAFIDDKVTGVVVNTVISQIAQTGINEVYQVSNPNGNSVVEKLYSPEEKLLAIDVLKILRSKKMDYKTWFEKVKKVLGEKDKYSVQDLNNILDVLK